MSFQWRKSCLNAELENRVFKLPVNSVPFQNYYDDVHKNLEYIPGMDEFLAGTVISYLIF